MFAENELEGGEGIQSWLGGNKTQVRGTEGARNESCSFSPKDIGRAIAKGAKEN
jgi:hypothetical protein